ncbi:MAG TPA: ATP-binding protein [Polyangiaceae bacterium]|nr:ATP-binding protein [Polyangiaceae bacterium]
MTLPPRTTSLLAALESGRLSRAHVERFAWELAARHRPISEGPAAGPSTLGYAEHVGSILKHVFLHEGRMVLERPGPVGGLAHESAGAASDVKGVMLELEAFGQSQLAHWFLVSWLLQSGAFDALEVLRAPARGAALRTREPFLVITHGVSGAGKTTLVGALVGATGALAVSNDAESFRLRCAGAELEPGVIGAKLEAQAVRCVRAGWPVIVESCFLSRDDRGRFRAAARALGAPFAIVACTAPLSLISERLDRRRSFGSLFHGSDASADAVHRALEAQIARTDALDESESSHAVMLDTAQPLDVARVTAQLDRILDAGASATHRQSEWASVRGVDAAWRRGQDVG